MSKKSIIAAVIVLVIVGALVMIGLNRKNQMTPADAPVTTTSGETNQQEAISVEVSNSVEADLNQIELLGSTDSDFTDIDADINNL